MTTEELKQLNKLLSKLLDTQAKRFNFEMVSTINSTWIIIDDILLERKKENQS